LQPHGLTLLSLAAAGAVALFGKRRAPARGLGVVAATICAWYASGLQVDKGVLFLGELWTLDSPGRTLLVFLYAATAALFAIGSLSAREASFSAPLLTSAGLLSAALLLRPSSTSFLVLPMALVAVVWTVREGTPPANRGASLFLACTAIPALLVPAAFTMLERSAMSGDASAAPEWAAWLLLLPAILWLTIFPSDGALRLWNRDQPSLGAAYLWVVKDVVVFYLLLKLWGQHPGLRDPAVLTTLGAVGFVTAVYNGVLAAAQPTPSAVLACAAMSALGIAVQGLASGSLDGVIGGLSMLIDRSAAVLLAVAALGAGKRVGARDVRDTSPFAEWRKWLVLAGFAVAALALAGAPWGALAGRQRVLNALEPSSPFLLLAWGAGSAGVSLGLARAVWTMWHCETLPSRGHRDDLLLVLVLGLLLLVLWVALRAEAMDALLSEWVSALAPSALATSDCFAAAPML